MQCDCPKRFAQHLQPHIIDDLIGLVISYVDPLDLSLVFSGPVRSCHIKLYLSCRRLCNTVSPAAVIVITHTQQTEQSTGYCQLQEYRKNSFFSFTNYTPAFVDINLENDRISWGTPELKIFGLPFNRSTDKEFYQALRQIGAAYLKQQPN